MRAVLTIFVCLFAACSSDNDGDGFDLENDCDDSNPTIHPGATELCNGLDDDCAGGVDDEPADGVPYFADLDGDGWGRATSACTKPATGTTDRDGDCHDDQPTAYPNSTATETPNDGIDTDCDGNDYCTDLNCDGRADVVVPSHYDGDYAISQSARLLSVAGGWGLEPAPIDMAGTLGVANFDLDHDGYQDVIHASYHDGVTTVASSFIYWGRNGHSQAGRQALPTNGAGWVCLGDFDKNSWVDIVFANFNDGDTDTVSYIYWNRAGAFSPTDRAELPTNGARYCEADDIDGDDNLDIVFAAYNNGTYTTTSNIYWGNATGTFSAANRTDLPTVGSLSATIADVDRDGRKDVVFWSHYDGTTHQTPTNFIYWNRGAGISATERTALSGYGPYHGAVVDLNNDSHNDIVVPGNYDAGWANTAPTYIYWGSAANVYSAANRAQLNHRGALNVVVDDINNDGYKDILLSSHHDGDSFAPSAIFWGTAGGTFSDTNRLELPGYHTAWGAGVTDFNHDGYKDIFLPGYHNNMTGADPAPWANQAFSRIYWGNATGLRATFFDQWPTRGAWSATIVGR